jgi:hypothetical protein
MHWTAGFQSCFIPHAFGRAASDVRLGIIRAMSIPKFIFCALFAILVLSVGCTKPKQAATIAADSSKIQDWRHGVSDLCPVHHVVMRTEVVYGLAGVIDPTRDYADARPRFFPYAGIDYSPDMYSKERGMIYVCPACVQAKNVWLKEHP